MLKAFIVKKGFGEPVVLHEILDHFACKVEELHALFPKKAFSDVMHEAHRSFGASGFYPLVKSFQEGLAGNYRRYFKKRLLGMLGFGMEPQDRRRLGWVVAAIGAVWAFQELCFQVLYSLVGYDWIEICIGGVFTAVFGIDILRIRKFARRPNAFTAAAQQGIYGTSPLLFIINIIVLNTIPKLAAMDKWAALDIALLIFVGIVAWLQQARYATIDKSLEDYKQRRALLEGKMELS